MSVPLEQQLLDQVRLRNWIFLGAMVLASLVFWDLKVTLGVAAGGVLVTINFRLLHRILKRQFRPEGRTSTASVLAGYYLRFAATGIIILLLLKFRLVHPIGLLIGLSVIVLTLTLTGFSLFLRGGLKEAL